MTTLMAAVLMLTACAGSAQAANRSGRTGVLSPGSKLALGIIKLEGTPQALDPVTAAKLLPLWQLMLQLDGGTSTAPQEITAVVEQIQVTLTPEQASAISGMRITQADFASVFQPQGSARSAGAGGASTGGASGNRNGAGPQGLFLGGGGIPGGGEFGGGTTRTAGTTGSTTIARTASTTSQNTGAVPVFLVNQVITLLESKIKG
jgi:hypothetical protein